MEHKASRFITVNKVKEEQEALLALGFKLDKYGADGKLGAETRAAMKAFLREIKYDPRDGKTPREALLDAAREATIQAAEWSSPMRSVTTQEAFALRGGEPLAFASSFVAFADNSGGRQGPVEQTPLEIAKRYIGLSGQKNPKEISRFIHQAADIKIDPRKTAWCAAFVNAVLEEAGIEGTGKLTARSFLDFGKKTKNPEPGDIAIFKRGQEAWQGHVGFVVDRFKRGDQWMVRVLAGNQDTEGKVSIMTFSEKKLLGYRKVPDDMDQPSQPVTRQASRAPSLPRPAV